MIIAADSGRGSVEIAMAAIWNTLPVLWRQRALAEHIIADIDHDSTIAAAYTEGAAQSNPAMVRRARARSSSTVTYYPGWGPGASTHHTEKLSVGMGTGTNNFGELWAIGTGPQRRGPECAAGLRPPGQRRNLD